MPRRPRPSHRPAPGKGGFKQAEKKNKPETAPKIRFADLRSQSETDDESIVEGDREHDEHVDPVLADDGEASEGGSSQGTGVDREPEREDDDEAEADIPRIAQWEDDEFVEEGYEDHNLEADTERTLKQNLKNLPLGALRQAQRVLSQVEPGDESDSGTESSNGSVSESDTKDGGKQKVEWSTKPRKDISKRSNKHAPTEVTSKRPVTRRRTVIEVPKIVARDPRFLSTAGEFSAEKFQSQYSFLAENHKQELATLRETLKQACKLLTSSPKDLRSEREIEVYRLRQAVKRAESTVNKDRFDQLEREALGRAKKDEQEKRTQGKGEWYLKKGEKQKLVMQARYEALAKEGGQRAIKKVIERRQKKQSQKEKRSRPYAKGEDGGTRKRGLEPDSGWPNKKRRV